MRNILVISYYWPPAGGSGVQRWAYFCKYLKGLGYHPIVITVDESEASYKFLDISMSDIVKDIEVHKTKTWELLKVYSKLTTRDTRSGIPLGFAGESNPSFFQKFSRFVRGNIFIPDARIGWKKYAIEKAKEIISNKKVDLIITTGPPHSSHLIGSYLKRKFGIKWIVDFRDPWSDIYYNNLFYRTRLASIIDKYLERKVLVESDFVLTVGPSMAKHLKEKANLQQSKISYVYNGFDSELFNSIPKNRVSEKFVIGHIGVLSESQPISPFIFALHELFGLQQNVDGVIEFKFVGKTSPAILNEIQRVTPFINVENIDYVPHDEAIKIMKTCDLLLNSFAIQQNTEMLVSGKLMEYIASGVPIICLGNIHGDAAEVISDVPNAKIYERADITGIAKFVADVFKGWGNGSPLESDSTMISKYSRIQTTKTLAAILDAIE